MILFSCKRTLLFLCVFTACLSFSIIAANATEVDSYTYTRFLKDGAVFEINDEINRLMEEAIREANQDDIHNSEDLYRILNKFLGGLIVTQIEEVIEQKNDGRVLKLDIRDSIYSDMWTFWAPSLMLSQKIGGVFKVDEYIIGTDKLGHFVSQGYTYFKICYLKGEGIEEALLFGINSELTYFGFLTTGIYSYGDLVANFQGLRFWNDILSEHPDILGERQQHYIQKKNGKWALLNRVDMRRYFDAGWDERINQNIYRNPLIADEVKKKIQSVSDSSASLDIQRSKTKFNMLNKRYKDYSRYLLNIGNTPKEHINELRRQLKLALKNRLLP